MEFYTVVNGKKYRKGYTTGSCAAAASKAAVSMLVSGEICSAVEIDTPAGIRLTLPVTDAAISNDAVKCSVVKDGGDDPDVTTGLKIFAEARFCDEAGVRVKAGDGIGIVTLPGLKVGIGQPAINPVPMKMILKEAGEVLPEGKGVEICLSIPGGEEIAKQTYNPKLGIMGGISILGTSGIVEPMSEEAWKESLALELGVMAAKSIKTAVFVFGNYGEDFNRDKLGINSDYIIKVSNFIGFMLDKAVENNFKKVLLMGHPGKLVKVAAGIFNTHSRVADARIEILAAYAALEGANHSTVGEIYSCKTTEAAMDIINRNNLNRVYDRITANASKRCIEYTFGKLFAGAVMFDAGERILSMDGNAKEIIRELE